jgi:hypothetical protein
LTLDLTSALVAVYSESISLSLIVLEVGPAPADPAELALTSREGDASAAPELVLEYCP